MGRPLVSVVIPAFNAEATLTETARSALASSYAPIEIIIVDDGSTDQTAEIARMLGAADARVEVVQRENGGLSAALNSGFARCRGDYIARLDADDLWHPAKLERQMEVAAAYPDAAFIYSFVRYVDEDGLVVHDGPRQEFPAHALCRGVYETIVGGGSSALMKRSAVIEAGGCDERFRSLEDLLLQLKISARHPVACAPQFLVGYRVRPGSLTRDLDTMLATWRAVISLVGSSLPQVPSFVRRWAHGTRCAHYAESFAWAGRWGMTAKLLAEAARNDPDYVARFLACRTGRRIARGAKPRDPRPADLHFFDCDPELESGVTPVGGRTEGRPLDRLRRRRELRLASLDAAIAARRLPAAAGEERNQRAQADPCSS